MMSLDWDALHFKLEGGYNISEKAQPYISSLTFSLSFTFSVKSESWKQPKIVWRQI